MKTMHTTAKIVFYWILIGVCFILHNLLHLSGIYYGKDMLLDDTAGVIPLGVHIFTLLVSVSPFIFTLLFLNFSSKGLLWTALSWSLLFLILNMAHFIETIAVEKPFNLSQGILLLFIFIVNVLLAHTLWHSVKQRKKRQL